MSKRKRYVCLGGGNAMPRAVLSELKKEKVFISAICAMLDSGGSAGRLRKEYKINSPGDIRRAFLALANTSPIIENLFNFRFEGGDLKGHNFANLFIAALELSTNDYKKTMKEVKRFLNIEHEVLPATLDRAELHAVLESGETIKGETNIDIPKHNGKLKIKKVFLKPKAKAYPLTIEAIRKADRIIIGPGDLFSSLAQILLVEGVTEAIRKSKAKTIYICNLMNKYGETNGYTVHDFTDKIESLIGGLVYKAIYNNKKISPERVRKYRKEHPELLEVVDVGKRNSKFLGADIVKSSGDIIHDSKKLVKVILSV